MYEIGKLPTLHLGRQGERNTTHIQIDVTPWMERYPTAGITLIVIRPREDEDAAYIASTEWIHDEETGTYVLSWIPNSGDTAIAGRGVAEVRAVVRGENGEDVIKKSVTVRTSIAPAIEESSDPPGPTQEGWISTLTALAGTVVNGAEQVAADKAQVHDDLTNMEELVDYAEHLDPIQVAIDVQTVIDSKDAAVAAASAASGSATAAEGSADSAADSASAASGSASAASGSATAAAGSADNAAGSATAAAGSASAAELHARNALDSSSYANARATAAASSASAAATSATNAQSSADAAEQSAQDAATAAADSVKVTSQSWSTTQQAQARSNIGATTDADLAIVANGNTHAAIASGQFVYVRNHSTLADGLYKATAAIGTNAALSTSNLSANTSGGLNDLQGKVATLNSNVGTLKTNLESNDVADAASYRNVWFSDSTNDLKRVHDTDFQYNPRTKDLKVGTINGKTVKEITYKDYEISFDGWTAGTPGTRAVQKTLSIASDISAYGAVIGMFIVYIADSSQAHYQAFIYNGSIYVNAYRANSSSVGSGYPINVRVVFAK